MKQNTILKRTLTILMCLMVVITGIIIPSTQTVNAATVAKYNFTSKLTSKYDKKVPIFKIYESNVSGLEGAKGFCTTTGKSVTSGKISTATEIAHNNYLIGVNTKKLSALTKNQKYLFAAFNAYYYNFCGEKNYTYALKYSRCFNYIRTGSYSSSWACGYSKSDFDNIIKAGQTKWNNYVKAGDSKAKNFRAWYCINSNSSQQNMLVWNEVGTSDDKFYLKLSKSAQEDEDKETLYSNLPSFEGIKYGIYKSKSDSSPIKYITLDEDGFGKVEVPEIGTYYAKEVLSNSNWLINSNWLGPVTITASSKTGTFYATGKNGDLQAPCHCTIIKKLDESGDVSKSLSGFHFTLTQIAETDISGDIEEGDFEEYTGDETSSDADLDDDEEYTGDEDIPIIFENWTDEKGEITSWKIVSPKSRKGEEITDLPFGIYKLEEILSPEQENAKCESITKPQLIILGPNDNKIIEWTNYYPVELQMQIAKKCNDGGSTDGFEFKITGPSFPNGTPHYFTKKILNGKTEIIRFGEDGTPLKQGTYKVEEVMTDAQRERYKQPASQTITLKNGETEEAVFEFVNEPWYKNLVMKKYSSDKKVKGLSFKLKGKTPWGKEITKTAVSDEKGYIYFKGLPAGTYSIEEQNFDSTKYAKGSSVIKQTGIVITKDSPNTVNLTKNKHYWFKNITYTPPKTGDETKILHKSIITLLAMLMIIFTLKPRKTDAK